MSANKEWDHKLAIDLYTQGKNDIEIGKACGVSPTSVRRLRSKLGLEKKPKNHKKEGHDKTTIDYSEKLIQSGFNDFGTNICWDCEKACGKCQWTAADPETGEIQFKPVPGWKAIKRRRKIGRKWTETNQIIECPLFEKTPDRESL